MNKKAMTKANQAASELFASQANDLTAKYNRLVQRFDREGYQEGYSRTRAIEELRKLKAKSLCVKGHTKLGQNDLLIMMYSEYAETIDNWFGTNEVRVEEWYSKGWPEFLQRHYHNNREHNIGCRVVAGWSFNDVCQFLAIQQAHRQLERLHDERMNDLWRQKTTPRDNGQSVESDTPVSPDSQSVMTVPTPASAVINSESHKGGPKELELESMPMDQEFQSSMDVDELPVTGLTAQQIVILLFPLMESMGWDLSAVSAASISRVLAKLTAFKPSAFKRHAEQYQYPEIRYSIPDTISAKEVRIRNLRAVLSMLEEVGFKAPPQLTEHYTDVNDALVEQKNQTQKK